MARRGFLGGSSSLAAAFAGVALVSTVSIAATLQPGALSTYKAMFEAHDRSQFPLVPASGQNAVADKVVVWDRLRRDNYKASFEQLSAFLGAAPGWPQAEAIRRRAELAITDSTPFAARLDFFGDVPPLTATGKWRLAEALRASAPDRAVVLAREAWRSGGLSDADAAKLRRQFGSALTADDHGERADNLMWAGRRTAASVMLPLLTPDQRRLIEARMALQARAGNAAQRLAAVPASLQADAGLLHDRVARFRALGSDADARKVLLENEVAEGSVLDPTRWINQRLILARDAFRDGLTAEAYRLAAEHNVVGGKVPMIEQPVAVRVAYTEAEWLAGWIALRHMSQAAPALDHFKAVYSASQTPISQSRADYWSGRAADALGRTDEARTFYRRAAEHNQFFYGQLAAEALGQPLPVPSIAPPPVSADAKAGFEASELVQAARILGQVGQANEQTLFLQALAEAAQTPEQKRLAADLATELNRPDLGVIVGKLAQTKGIGEDLTYAAYPQFKLQPELQPMWTMVHAISRQESLFNPKAVSSANARGLMQLLPGTAQQVAREMGLGYSYGRLTEDPVYNMTLGSTYYRNMLDRFGGSHVLAVASYNAGPGRVSQWINRYGDPRSGRVDIIDWIEQIPFRETRNYVQRVLENAVVYDLIATANAAQQGDNDRVLSEYLGKDER